MALVDIQGAQLVLTALFCGTASVLLAVALIRMWDRRGPGAGQGRGGRSAALDGQVQPVVFLFRGNALVDATPPARALLDRVAVPDDDWLRLMQWVGPRFGHAAEQLSQLSHLGQVELLGQQGQGSATLRLLAEDLGDHLWRVTITDPQSQHCGTVVDSMSLQAMEEELHLLRGALDQTPMLVWRLDQPTVGDGSMPLRLCVS